MQTRSRRRWGAAGVNGAAAGWPRNALAPLNRTIDILRQWSRGRLAAEWGPWPPPPPARPSVNGAAAGWPRNGRGAAAGAKANLSVNGAAAGWPRNGGGGRPARGRPAGVNGAAAGWPRNVPQRPGTHGWPGMRQWSRGRLAAECAGAGAPPQWIVRVNGAAAGWPRNGPADYGVTTWKMSVNGAAAGWPRNEGLANDLQGGRARQWSRGRLAAE